MNPKLAAYWTSTALFCSVLGFSGASHFLHLDFMVENMAALGYPLYFMTVVGAFKLLGVGALLIPGFPLLKEWAYAGFSFNLIGAAASHIYSGDEFSHSIRPLLILTIGAASYLLRPDSRRLSQSFGAGVASNTAPTAEET